MYAASVTSNEVFGAHYMKGTFDLKQILSRIPNGRIRLLLHDLK